MGDTRSLDFGKCLGLRLRAFFFAIRIPTKSLQASACILQSRHQLRSFLFSECLREIGGVDPANHRYSIPYSHPDVWEKIKKKLLYLGPRVHIKTKVGTINGL